MNDKKRVLFRGLGPTGNIVHNETIIEDGAIVELEDNIADAYITLGLAHEVVDEEEARAKQEQIIKNKARREEIISKSLKKEDKKKKVGEK